VAVVMARVNAGRMRNRRRMNLRAMRRLGEGRAGKRQRGGHRQQ
jgi:hypothetical protein